MTVHPTLILLPTSFGHPPQQLFLAHPPLKEQQKAGLEVNPKNLFQ